VIYTRTVANQSVQSLHWPYKHRT